MLQAFDESSSFLGAVKALESFEGLLDRPALALVVRKCGDMLMSDLTLDLRRVCWLSSLQHLDRIARRHVHCSSELRLHACH